MERPFFAPERFEADGFVIRCYRVDDGSALQKAVNQSYEHLKPWMPWATADQSMETSESNCRRFVANYLRNEDFTLGIWSGSELLGSTGFHLRHGPLAFKNAEIGIWISAAQAGKGLGTRVLRAMLQWGFTDWGWERLVWKCDVRNLASAKVAEKGGLVLEGTLREELPINGERRSTHLYAILRKEWESRR